MESAIKILENVEGLSWNYDEEADVLYMSVGKPKAAIGIDAGDGTILRYDEKSRKLVGITFLGLQARLLKGISKGGAGRKPKKSPPAKRAKS